MNNKASKKGKKKSRFKFSEIKLDPRPIIYFQFDNGISDLNDIFFEKDVSPEFIENDYDKLSVSIDSDVLVCDTNNVESLNQILDDEPNFLYVYEPDDTNELTPQELQRVWDNRLELCGSIEGACEVFALLKAYNSDDENYYGWKYYLNHELINELKNDLPFIYENKDKIIDDIDSLSLIIKDERVSSTRNIKIREGQLSFRDIVLNNFDYKCCITNCSEISVLEAAHIISYNGDKTNISTNGLCLRVDIHRLFDKYFLSINPNNLVVELSITINDENYRQLHLNELKGFIRNISKFALKDHYGKFLRHEEDRKLKNNPKK